MDTSAARPRSPTGLQLGQCRGERAGGGTHGEALEQAGGEKPADVVGQREGERAEGGRYHGRVVLGRVSRCVVVACWPGGRDRLSNK
ncbi:hypothetical protein SUDANB178_07202 [Streptomyces sp. enrichment culture]